MLEGFIVQLWSLLKLDRVSSVRGDLSWREKAWQVQECGFGGEGVRGLRGAEL